MGKEGTDGWEKEELNDDRWRKGTDEQVIKEVMDEKKSKGQEKK